MVASVAAQQTLLATAPLSLLAAIGVVNRQRLRNALEQQQRETTAPESPISQRLSQLQRQVNNRPTLDAFNRFQRSIAAYNKQTMLRFSHTVAVTQQELEAQLKTIEIPNTDSLRLDLVRLQENYTTLCAAINHISVRCQQLSDNSRMKKAEAELANLKAEVMQLRVNLDILSFDIKNEYAAVQDRLRHGEMVIQQLQQRTEGSLLKEELRGVAQTVARMVPRSEFMQLTSHLQELRSQYYRLSQTYVPPAHTPVEQRLGQVLAGLDQDLVRWQQQLHGEDSQLGDIVSRHLEECRRQLTTLQQLGTELETEHRQLQEQLRQLPSENITRLYQRIEQQHQRLNSLSARIETPAALPAAATSDPTWIIDFAQKQTPAGAINKANGRQALEQLILDTQEQLLIAWSVDNAQALDARLISLLTQLLERGGRLTLGWCYQHPGRDRLLLSRLRRQWTDGLPQPQPLREALKRLQPLKQIYPNRFSLKLLGSAEHFAICDRATALIGLEPLNATSQVLPRVIPQIKTADPRVIRPLLKRFEQPIMSKAEDYLSRGYARYQLENYDGALSDWSHAVRLRPNFAVALTYCSVAQADLGRLEEALASVSRALRLRPNSFVARCNRGRLYLDQGNIAAAQADFRLAIELHPRSSLPYFYLGQVYQRQNQTAVALQYLNLAIDKRPGWALAHCYRAATHRRLGNLSQAVADLSTAQRLWQTVGVEPTQIQPILAALRHRHRT